MRSFHVNISTCKVQIFFTPSWIYFSWQEGRWANSENSETFKLKG